MIRSNSIPQLYRRLDAIGSRLQEKKENLGPLIRLVHSDEEAEQFRASLSPEDQGRLVVIIHKFASGDGVQEDQDKKPVPLDVQINQTIRDLKTLGVREAEIADVLSTPIFSVRDSESLPADEEPSAAELVAIMGGGKKPFDVDLGR